MVYRSILKFLHRIFSYLSRRTFELSQSPNQHDENRCSDDADSIDDVYFGSYGDLEMQKAMVADHARTDAFRQSILKSREKLLHGSVLDVGCGTGILSVFACQAGADRVVAVDASAMIQCAKRVVDENQCSDKILLVKSRIENYSPTSEKKFDALISEWMGNCLFAEWMLPSVINARDRFLKEGGLMFPEKVGMFVALVKETKYLFGRAHPWRVHPRTCYDLDVDSIAEDVCANAIGKRITHIVIPDDIVSDADQLLELDLYSIKAENCDKFSGHFHLIANESCDVYGFALWFNALFPADVELNTSPFHKRTHWAQNVVYVTPFSVQKGSIVSGSVTFRRFGVQSEVEKRCLLIDLAFELMENGKQTAQFEYMNILVHENSR